MDIVDQERSPLTFQTGTVHHRISVRKKSVAYGHTGKVEQLPLLGLGVKNHATSGQHQISKSHTIPALS